MAKKHRSSSTNIHESFSDIALLMLATFVFLLVTIMITSKLAEENQLPQLKASVAELEERIKRAETENRRLLGDLDSMANMSVESQMEAALEAVDLGKSSKRRKDFDLFVKGLKEIPGDSIHLMVDATGSMHGAANFLIPVLRVIVIRTGKKMDAITWFSDGTAATYQGSVGSMFDNLMSGAPFVGSEETIGRAFRYAVSHAPVPGAYILIGDEPSDDRIYYSDIPRPVFTIPIGKTNADTLYAYEKLARETRGKMLQLVFQ